MAIAVVVYRSLRHPHIVQFMGLCKHEHELFIITEYVDGGDLYDKLRDPTVRTHA